MSDVLRIANCSGFYGDRLSAAREMVEGGPIDVLTGDYLAELTLMILLKDRLKDPSLGYARTFLRQLEEIAVDLQGARHQDRRQRRRPQSGGLRRGGARALQEARRERRRRAPRGRRPAAEARRAAGARASRSRTSTRACRSPRCRRRCCRANAYLGGWGIAAALERGADLVICPRVTDAALTLGPAAWKFGWKRDDWDRLAAGVVAGHVIECGAQCTGGNYAFFQEVPGLEHPGFPIAEMRRRRQLRHHQASRHRRPGVGRHGDGAAALRDRRARAIPTPTSRRASTPSALTQEGPDRVLRARRAAASRRRRPPRSASTTSAATGTA